jgi:hypothetical protein
MMKGDDERTRERPHACDVMGTHHSAVSAWP